MSVGRPAALPNAMLIAMPIAIPTHPLRGHMPMRVHMHRYMLSSAAALEETNLFEQLPPALAAQLKVSTHKRLAIKYVPCPSLAAYFAARSYPQPSLFIVLMLHKHIHMLGGVIRCAFFKNCDNSSLVTLIAALKAAVFIPGQIVSCPTSSPASCACAPATPLISLMG